MGRLGMVGVLGVLFVASACGGGEEKQGSGINSEGTGGSGAQGGTGGTSVLVPCTGCSDPTDGCITTTVTPGTNLLNLPWSVWPAEADGRGMLIVAAYNGTSTLARQEVADADFSTASAHYDVTLRCVPMGMQYLNAFLDDDGDAAASATSSADYVDACPMTRMPAINVYSETTARLDFVLANSCD